MMQGADAGISVVSILFVNNAVFMLFLGLKPVLSPHRLGVTTVVSCATMSLAIILSCIAGYCVDRLVLIPAQATTLHLLVFILVGLAVASLIEVVMQRWYPLIYDQTGLAFPIVTVETVVVGCTYLVCSDNPFSGLPYTLTGCIIFAVLNAAGYCLARVIMEGIQEKMGDVPAGGLLDGLPRILIACSLVSLVFLGLSGMIL